MTDPHAIIFDLDGTLIHSAPDMHVSLNRALDEVGRAALDLETVTSFVGNGVETLVERSLLATGGADAVLRDDVVASFLRDYDRQKTVLTRPYPGVMHRLDQLRAAGIPMGLCTNKPQEPAREMCIALGLAPYFTVIAGAVPDVPKKPDPAPLLRCIKALGVEAAATIYVGDSVVDYQTAQNADVPFWFFTGGYLNAPLPDPAAAQNFDDWQDVDFTLA